MEMSRQRCLASQRPRLLDRDPNAVMVGGMPGDIVRVTKMGDTGKSHEYFLVVDPQYTILNPTAVPTERKDHASSHETDRIMNGLMDQLEECVETLNGKRSGEITSTSSSYTEEKEM